MGNRKRKKQALANAVNPTAGQPVTEVDATKYRSADDPANVSMNPPSTEDKMVDFLKTEDAGKTSIANITGQNTLPPNETILDKTRGFAQQINPTNPLIAKATEEVVNDASQSTLGPTPNDVMSEVAQNDEARNAMTWQSDGINYDKAVSDEGKATMAQLTANTEFNPNNEFTTDNVGSGVPDVTDGYKYGDEAYDRRLDQYAAALKNQGRVTEPAIERLGIQDYYPDINQGIRVGGYSGSIVGNNDIMVAQGGILPMGVLDARKRALEKAAVDKAKEKEKLFEMANVQGAYPYQQQLNDEIMNYNSKFGELAGYDWTKLKPGSNKLAMEYWNGVKKLQTLGRATTEIHKKVEDLFSEQTSKGEKHVSAEQQKMMGDWLTGGFEINKIMKDPKEEQRFYAFAKKLKAYDNVTFYAREAATVMQKSMDKVPLNLNSNLDFNDKNVAKNFADLYRAKQSGDYDLLAKAMLTFVDDDRLDNAARGLVDQHRFDLGGDYENQVNYVKRQLLADLGKSVDITERIAQKNTLGWARLAHDKQKDIQMQPYTQIHSIGNSDATKQNIQAIYGNRNLTKQQKTEQGAKALENVIGGKLIKSTDGNQKLEYLLPFKAEKGKEYKFTSDQLFDADARNRIANQKDQSKEVKEAINQKDAVWGADIVNRKAQYYVTKSDGQIVPVTENDLINYPELAGKMKIHAKNEYNPYLLITDDLGKTKKVYTGHTSNIQDDLDNPNARYEYDADVKENIPTMNRDIKAGDNYIESPNFGPGNEEEVPATPNGSLNAPK